MGKNNNLKDFVTDIADAIREKRGTTELINPQDFSNEIKGIESGSPEADYNDITFFDYNGKIVYSYTWDEFVAKNEMPPLPQHDGLESIGWNWKLENIFEQPNHMACIGLLVRPDDGSSRLLVSAFGTIEIDVIAPAEGLRIDWGDGSIETYTEGNHTLKHDYTKLRTYGIRVISNGSNRVSFGFGGDNTNVFFRGDGKLLEANWCNCILKQGCMNALRYVVISISNISHITGIFNNTLTPCLVLDDTIRSNNIWGAQGAFTYIICGNRLEQVISNSGAIGIKMPYFVCPTNVVKIGHYGLSSFYGYYIDLTNNPNLMLDGVAPSSVYLKKLLLPANLIKIPDNMVRGCIRLPKVTIPSKVTSVGTQSFDGCTELKEVDFSQVEVVPTLSNVNAFTNTTCSIVVPDALYDEWIVATNWSTLVDRIVKASEYVEPTND